MILTVCLIPAYGTLLIMLIAIAHPLVGMVSSFDSPATTEVTILPVLIGISILPRDRMITGFDTDRRNVSFAVI